MYWLWTYHLCIDKNNTHLEYEKNNIFLALFMICLRLGLNPKAKTGLLWFRLWYEPEIEIIIV
jgi:hypothetical protein